MLHRLHSFFLPLCMFPFLRAAREGRATPEAAATLSERFGSGSMPSLDGLFEAWQRHLQKHCRRLEAAGPRARGWAVLRFLLRCNWGFALQLALLTALHIAGRFAYLISFDQVMAALNDDSKQLWFPYSNLTLWLTVAVFCACTVWAFGVAYVIDRQFYLFGIRLRNQAIWLAGRQLLHCRLAGFDANSSMAQVLNMLGPDARSFEYTNFAYKLLQVPLEVALVVVLFWYNLAKNAAATFGSLAIAFAMLVVVQPLLTALFTRKVKQARAHRAARLDASRDGIVNYLPAKLFGMERTMCQLAMAQRRLEERCLLVAYGAYAFVCANQLFLPAVVTTIATVLLENQTVVGAAAIFTTLSYAKTLTSEAFYHVSYSLTHAASLVLSCERLGDFLVATDPGAGPTADPCAAHTEPAEDGSSGGGGAAAGGQPEAGRCQASGAAAENESAALPAVGKELGSPRRPTVTMDKQGGLEAMGLEVWWPGSEAPALRVPSLSIRPGQLVVVCGGVASGKSTLLLGLLRELGGGGGGGGGQMGAAGPERPAVAYCPQTPAFIHDTIKANILFGLPEDTAALRAALQASGLAEDVGRMQQGLGTLVAEKGTSLSGGQRIRLGLARAAYAATAGGAPIVILDNPLAGVDPERAHAIFERLIGRGGLLEGRTRVVATTDPALLPLFDQVLNVEDHCVRTEAPKPPDGAMSAKAPQSGGLPAGATAVVVVKPKGPEPAGAGSAANQKRLLPTLAFNDRQYYDQAVPEAGGHEWVRSERPVHKRSIDQATLGAGQRGPGWRELQRMQGLGTSAVLLAAMVLVMLVTIAWQLMIFTWVFKEELGEDYPPFRLATKILLGALVALALAALLGQVLALLKGSSEMLRAALARVLAAPYTFYQANPSSVLMSRLAEDQQRVDEQLTKAYIGLVTTLTSMLAALVMSALSAPYMLILLVPMGVLFWWLRKKHTAAALAVRRLEAAAGSAVAEAGAEIVETAVVARAFKQEALMAGRLRDALASASAWNDCNALLTSWITFACNVWIYCSISIVATILAAAILGREPDSKATLLLSNIFQISSLLSAIAGTLCTTESELTSLRRVRQLAQLETEDDAVRRLDPQTAEQLTAGDKPSKRWLQDGLRRLVRRRRVEGVQQPTVAEGWPAAGCIEFQHLTAGYDWELQPALADVCLRIPAGTSCAVVGHSGSGKSTLVLALTWLIPHLSGNILLDGVDLRLVPTQRLRAGMAVVPQEPVVFKGTVRYNLDLHGSQQDTALWEVLGMLSLAESVRGLGGLDAELDPQSGVLSKGQMQLLCMARALLRDCSVLVLDESNASVDDATDEIMEAFVQRFVAGQAGLSLRRRSLLQVSHRATGLLCRDQVVVMDRGCVVEAGPPAELLPRQGARFGAMMAAATGGTGAVAEKGADGA